MSISTTTRLRGIFEEIKNAGRELKNSEYEEELSNKYTMGGYYIFFSFDLVNSTSYKSRSPKKWPGLFNHFYEYTKEQMVNYFEDIHVWKYVGDEVLFFLKIREKSEFYCLCKYTTKVQKVILKSINENYPDTKGILNIKATIWSADVTPIKPGDREENKESELEEGKNLIFFHPDSKGINFDFLGPDIDIGFRISKFSEKNQLVVGADLAYILYEGRGQYEEENLDKIEEQLKIVSFESLKGVWNGRKYPIIWYNENWGSKEKIFEYDERFTSPIVKNIYEKDFNLENISSITKVYEDMNNKEKISQIIKAIVKGEYNTPFKYEVFAKNRAEVHCVSICVNSKCEILIAKRNNKPVLNQKWEFGCGQISIDSDFNNFLIDIYKKDFNIDIDLLKENGELVPISTYTLKNSNGLIVPGIIFVARIESGPGEDFKLPEKYSEYKFVSYEDLSGYPDYELVPLMKSNAKKALSILNN